MHEIDQVIAAAKSGSGTKGTCRRGRSMSVVGLQSGKHTLALIFSGFDLGCVKTRLRDRCAELFSQLPSSERGCQCNRFRYRRNRDGNSTRKLRIGVFTQSGPRTEVEPSLIATGYPRAASNEYLLADLEAHQVLADHERPGIGVARFGDQIFDRRCGHVLARQ